MKSEFPTLNLCLIFLERKKIIVYCKDLPHIPYNTQIFKPKRKIKLKNTKLKNNSRVEK